MAEEQVSNYQSTAILKELSDIKESLAINTTETANIKASMTEIKSDIREIKADFVSRREFVDTLEKVKVKNDDIETRMRSSETREWKFIGALICCQILILPIAFYVIFKIIK